MLCVLGPPLLFTAIPGGIATIQGGITAIQGGIATIQGGITAIPRGLTAIQTSCTSSPRARRLLRRARLVNGTEDGVGSCALIDARLA